MSPFFTKNRPWTPTSLPSAPRPSKLTKKLTKSNPISQKASIKDAHRSSELLKTGDCRDPSIDQPTAQSIDESIRRSIEQSIDALIYRLITGLINRLNINNIIISPVRHRAFFIWSFGRPHPLLVQVRNQVCN